jgi:hypothetical protein
MLNMSEITTEYFREYREKIGFTNQNDAKDFFGAKDITPTIDFDYIDLLNKRLYGLVDKIDFVVNDKIRSDNLSAFKKKYIDNPFKTIKKNKILPVLNNQGRRPEQVYFSWMRGFVISNYFLKFIGFVFEIYPQEIKLIGNDDFKNIETFRRTPKADLEIKLNKQEKIRLEIQSGFTGINDIKQHKVLEAKRVFENLGIESLAVHFDLYNGQVAFIKLNKIEDNNINWITRHQMEGQTVFNIDQNNFVWRIIDKPLKYKEMVFN